MNYIGYVNSRPEVWTSYNDLELPKQLADALVEYETLDLSEVQKVVKGEPIRPVEEKLLEAAQAEEQQAVEREAEVAHEESDPSAVS